MLLLVLKFSLLLAKDERAVYELIGGGWKAGAMETVGQGGSAVQQAVFQALFRISDIVRYPL